MKKIVLGVLLFGLIGVLVAGAVIRTVAKSGHDTEAYGGYGRNQEAVASVPGAGATVESLPQGGVGWSESGGYGRNREAVENSPNARTTVESPRRGGAGWQARGASSADGAATGQAEVSEWLVLEGVVASVDEEVLLVQMTAGDEVMVEGRPWLFALEQGFTALPGDRVTLMAFDEDGELKVGQITDLTSGQSLQLRDDSGRPMWAGRGWRSG